MSITTLSDLVFHIRDVAAGRTELLSTRFLGRPESISTTDFLSNVHSLALALEARGLHAGERVAIFSENRPEWHVVDFACHLLGLPTVPIRPDVSPSQVAYILRNSGSRWVFYSDLMKRDLLSEIQTALTAALQIVAFDADATMPEGMSLTRLMGIGAEHRGHVPIERFRGQVAETDLASIVYTLGTSGDPRGVMLTHRNLVSGSLACSNAFQLHVRDAGLSLLPLAEVFQRTLDYACFSRGVSLHYEPSSRRITEALSEVRPTVMASDSEFFEDLYQQAAAKGGGRRGRLMTWALGVGLRHAAARRQGFVGPALALERKLAELLAFRDIKKQMGGRLRLAISAGVLSASSDEFFDAVALPVYQGLAFAETLILAVNGPPQRRRGSIGRPLPSVELRIAEDGEILARGESVAVGYWKNTQATENAFDGSGWFHTGAVGRLDDLGYVYTSGSEPGTEPAGS